jgi:hypothetical protein
MSLSPLQRAQARANPHHSSVLMAVEEAVKAEPVGEFTLKGIRRPLAAYNAIAAQSSEA